MTSHEADTQESDVDISLTSVGLGWFTDTYQMQPDHLTSTETGDTSVDEVKDCEWVCHYFESGVFDDVISSILEVERLISIVMDKLVPDDDLLANKCLWAFYLIVCCLFDLCFYKE
uniref:Uncharacterized protein n=1 Tax=Nelumbo nucifera TaxID=4432 RepID=A0A822YGQ9_NELNU|nr:TPA_asm: hypothetical protein HUJ06_030126 [Nelumbo nucifera]